MFCCQSTEKFFFDAAKALAVLAFGWIGFIVSISTDGDRKITGRIQGVGTPLEQAPMPNLHCISFATHQFDIKLQSFFASLLGEQF